MFSTILASSMAFIDSSALNVALPAIQADLHASGAQLLWVINAYLVMLAALILPGGSLGDMLGRKKVFVTGIGLFVLASLGCGIAPTIEILIAARVVEGIGGALMIPGSLAIITTFFTENRRGQAIGTWSAATTIVTIVGPILGGVLSNAGLWRAVFLINLPLGIATLLALHYRVPESRGEQGPVKIDVAGIVLIVVGLAGLTYGFISAPDNGFGNPLVIAPLVIGVAALVGFVIVEWRSPNPMMPLRIFGSQTFTGVNLLTFFLYGALSAGTFFLSLNLIQAQGYNMAVAGFTFLPFSLLLTVLSRRAGRYADQHGVRLPLIVGPALVGLGFLWMSVPGLTRGPVDYWQSFFPGIVLLGLGMGITVAPLTTAVMGSVSTSDAGKASGINNAVSRTAGVLMIAVVGAVALLVFSSTLELHTASLPLSTDARATLHAEAGRLGGATVPGQVPQAEKSRVEQAIKQSFVDVFRVVMWICTGSVLISVLMTIWMVRWRNKPSTS